MTMSEEPDRRNAEDMEQMGNESDEASMYSSDDGSEESGAAAALVPVGSGSQGAGQPVDQAIGFQTPANVYVEAVVPKSFHNSMFRDFVPHDKWAQCERNETEAAYVLEQVRQKLMSQCAPGKGQWKSRPDTQGASFLPLPDPRPASPQMRSLLSHGLIRLPNHCNLPNQLVPGDEKLMFKVVMGTVEFEIGGNRAPPAKVAVNAQIQIPPKTYFRIKNEEWDEALIYYSSEKSVHNVSSISF